MPRQRSSKVRYGWIGTDSRLVRCRAVRGGTACQSEYPRSSKRKIEREAVSVARPGGLWSAFLGLARLRARIGLIAARSTLQTTVPAIRSYRSRLHRISCFRGFEEDVPLYSPPWL